MENIYEKLAKLSPEKRAALEKYLQAKKQQTQPKTSVPHLDRSRPLALSFSQLRMWFIDQLEPGNPAYNRPTHCRLIGDLKVEILERSLNEIIRRHEILRTNFPTIDGQPVQAIATSFTSSLPVIDLSNLSGDEQKRQLQQLASEENTTPFNLQKEPLLRAKLLRSSPTEHVLLLTFHHIVFDGWSEGILIKELAALYDAFAKGQPSPLVELSIQYADFAQWQREKLNEIALQSQLDYWKSQLGGELPILELPTDRRRSPTQTSRGAKHCLALPKTLSDDLKKLSLQKNTTLFMTLLTAFQILLARYTREQDILVGTPIAGRDQIETESLIGIFINTLVFRTEVDLNLSFEALLAQVRQTTLDAYRHQTFPFDRLVQELQSERNLSHTPIFQVLFQLRNLPSQVTAVDALKIEKLDLATDTAMVELALEIEENQTGLTCVFKYNCDLFNATTIQRMAGHFNCLLEAVVSDLKTLVGQLQLLTQTERHQLLHEWNQTADYSLEDKCIHQLFEEQVERTPEAIAVVFEDQQLTYQELNERANQLAHYLLSKGVKPETLVGLCVGRSPEMIVAILGILKAGAAYVPLDPNYPAERLSYIIQDAKLPLIISNKISKQSLPTSQAEIICFDKESVILAQQIKDNLALKLSLNVLAYVVYTSGSTGQPKGVMIEHYALQNYVQFIKKDFKITKDDRVLQFATICFDAAVEEIYPCLISGATLVLRTEQMLSSTAIFLRTCQAWGITFTCLPTSYWHQIIAELEATLRSSLPSSLRLITIGGERAIPTSVKQWQKQVGEYPRLLNGYGPTEATVIATSWWVEPFAAIEQEVPIGKPLTNVQTHILDTHLNPVPIGVAGELHIGGSSLARGYLNRPKLTKEKFIPNPFSRKTGDRLYKTGDLARYLPDGNIEFLGRIDNQVKIRGFRIELGEIEATLTEHPKIQENVVVVGKNLSGQTQIIAYLVTKETNSQSSEFRSFLKSKLPDYMLPSAFIFLDKLPLTPNGKIDRRALPKPDFNQQRDASKFIAPNTTLEKEISQIWCDILQLDKISIDEDFFELGGHSLLAVQIISRVNANLEIEMPLRSLFEYSTIATWAEQVGQILVIKELTNNQENTPIDQSWEEFEL